MTKLIVVSDLHLKNDHTFEEKVLSQLASSLSLKCKKNDAIVFAGDIFDSSEPKIRVVELFKSFIENLPTTNIFIISGNHEELKKFETYFSYSSVFKPWYNSELRDISDILGWEDTAVVCVNRENFNKGEEALGEQLKVLKGEKSKLLVVTHIRGKIEPYITAEYTTENIEQIADTIISGDIHYWYEVGKIKYAGCPISRAFTGEKPSGFVSVNSNLKVTKHSLVLDGSKVGVKVNNLEGIKNTLKKYKNKNVNLQITLISSDLSVIQECKDYEDIIKKDEYKCEYLILYNSMLQSEEEYSNKDNTDRIGTDLRDVVTSIISQNNSKEVSPTLYDKVEEILECTE